MLTPEEAALEIRNFAKDETGLGNVKSAFAALDVIKKYIVDAKPASEDQVFGTLFWQHLNLLWKLEFVKLSFWQKRKLKRFIRSLERVMHNWKDAKPHEQIQIDRP